MRIRITVACLTPYLWQHKPRRLSLISVSCIGIKDIMSVCLRNSFRQQRRVCFASSHYLSFSLSLSLTQGAHSGGVIIEMQGIAGCDA